MRLLVVTQAVNLDNQAMGFFHGWIEELAKYSETIHVICLEEGRRTLSPHVHVHSLGKEGGRSRLKYIFRFYRYIFSLRNDYDVVLVHMNSEYVVLGGLFWKMMGKRIVLWRNHKMRDLYTWIAVHFASKVCYTSPSAYVAQFKNAVKMPVGIDTEFFKPGGENPIEPLLFLGRLDAVKKPDIFLEAISRLAEEGKFVRVDVYGDPSPGREAYAIALKEKYRHLSNVAFYPGVPNEQTPSLYASHAVYVNLTPSGSFDKTIGEAMACGCIVVVANDALRGVVPDALITKDDVPSTVSALKAVLTLSQDKCEEMSRSNRTYVEREHSLTLLMERLVGVLKG